MITRPSGPPSEPQRQGTIQQPTQSHQSQAGPKSKTYAHALQERLPDTVVIGTSLVRGVGYRLRERGIDNCVYCLPGAELPLVHKKLGDILIPGKIPKNIIIHASGNDIGRHRTDMVVQEYDKLINTLKSKCPKSNIWLCKIPRRSHLSWLHGEIAKVNTFLQKSFHGEKNVRFIDSCPEFGPRYFRRDMTHFTPHGVHVYGDKIACSMINFHIKQIDIVSKCIRSAYRGTIYQNSDFENNVILPTGYNRDHIKDMLESGILQHIFLLVGSPADGFCLLHSFCLSIKSQFPDSHPLSINELFRILKNEVILHKERYLTAFENDPDAVMHGLSE